MRFCGAVNLPIVYTSDYFFEIGKAVELKSGEKIAIIATGTDVVSESIKASNIIENRTGIKPSVINMHTIKPLDTEKLDILLENHNLIVTIEEHNVIGGLGSAVAEYLVTKVHSAKQMCIGIEDKNYIMGKRPFMLEQVGLTSEKIAERITASINNIHV